MITEPLLKGDYEAKASPRKIGVAGEDFLGRTDLSPVVHF